jgi:hypothetical protein
VAGIPWIGTLVFETPPHCRFLLIHASESADLILRPETDTITQPLYRNDLKVLELLVWEAVSISDPEERTGLHKVQLYDIVWPTDPSPRSTPIRDYKNEADKSTVRNNVQGAIKRLKAALGPRAIDTVGSTYIFCGDVVAPDLSQHEGEIPGLSPARRVFPEPATSAVPNLIRLADLPNPAKTDRSSRLLHPWLRAFDYVKRQSHEDTLWQWLTGETSGSRISLKVITGDPGVGKTRLAIRLLELIHEREPDRWAAGFVTDDTATDVLRSDQVRRNSRQTLVIIDDAALTYQSLIDEVINTFSGHDVGPPLRFLLLERSASEDSGWFEELNDAVSVQPRIILADEPVLRVEGFELNERVELFTHALLRLSEFRRQPALDVNEAVADLLAVPGMATPLALLMSALNSHERRALSGSALSDSQLAAPLAAKERQRIRAIARSTNCPAYFLRHMAAFVTLARGLSRPELRAACEAEAVEIASSLVDRSAEIASLIEERVLLSPHPGAAPISPQAVALSFLERHFRSPQSDPGDMVLRALRFKPLSVARTLTTFHAEWVSWVLDEVMCYPETRALARLRADCRKDRAYLPELVHNLHARAKLFADARNSAAAARFHNEASRVFHSLTTTDDIGMYFASFAEILANDANQKAVEGDFASGLSSINRALAMYRRATDRYRLGPRHDPWRSRHKLPEYRHLHEGELDPELFYPALGHILHIRAVCQQGLNQTQAALETISEAIVNYRQSMQFPNWDQLPCLISALSYKAEYELGLNRATEAWESTLEAWMYCFELLRISPRRYIGAWTSLHNNLVYIQSTRKPDYPTQASVAGRLLMEVDTVRKGLPEMEHPGVTETRAMYSFEVGFESVGLNIAQIVLDDGITCATKTYVVVDLGKKREGDNVATRLPDVFRTNEDCPPRDRLAVFSDVAATAEPQPLSAFAPTFYSPWFRVCVDQLHNRHLDNPTRRLQFIDAAVQHCQNLVQQNSQFFLAPLADWLRYRAVCLLELGHGDMAAVLSKATLAHVQFLDDQQRWSGRGSLRDLEARPLMLKGAKWLSEQFNVLISESRARLQESRDAPLLHLTLLLFSQVTIYRVTEPIKTTVDLLREAVPYCFELQRAGHSWISLREVVALLSDTYSRVQLGHDGEFPEELGWLAFTAAQACCEIGDREGALSAIDKALPHYYELLVEDRTRYAADVDWMRTIVAQTADSRRDLTDDRQQRITLMSLLLTQADIHLHLGQIQEMLTPLREAAPYWCAFVEVDQTAFRWNAERFFLVVEVAETYNLRSENHATLTLEIAQLRLIRTAVASAIGDLEKAVCGFQETAGSYTTLSSFGCEPELADLEWIAAIMQKIVNSVSGSLEDRTPENDVMAANVFLCYAPILFGLLDNTEAAIEACDDSASHFRRALVGKPDVAAGLAIALGSAGFMLLSSDKPGERDPVGAAERFREYSQIANALASTLPPGADSTVTDFQKSLSGLDLPRRYEDACAATDIKPAVEVLQLFESFSSAGK